MWISIHNKTTYSGQTPLLKTPYSKKTIISLVNPKILITLIIITIRTKMIVMVLKFKWMVKQNISELRKNNLFYKRSMKIVLKNPKDLPTCRLNLELPEDVISKSMLREKKKKKN